MADSSPSPDHCLNCGNALNGKFCSECGQSASTRRISFKDTLDDFFSSTLALQGPLFFTLKSLFANPGRMLREFIEGKRKTYYKPVAFFIVLTAFYLIVKALINYDPLEGQFQPTQQNVNPIQQRSQEAARWMVQHINHIMLILVLAIGANLKLFFRKCYNFTEYLIVGFYTVGMYILFATCIIVIDKYIITTPKSLMFGFLVLYLIYTCHSLFQRGSVWAYIKYLLVGLFSVIMYVILGFGVSYVVVGM